MTSCRKRKRINFDDCDGDVVMGHTPKQTAYSHFTHSPSGRRDRDRLSQAYEQTYAIYRIGNSVYVAGTKSIRDVYDDIKIATRDKTRSR